MPIIVNGYEYAFGDVRINMMNRSLIGFNEYNYKTSRKHKNVIGRGGVPVAKYRGDKDYDGDLVLLQGEYEALQRSFPAGKDITDMEFNVTVAYAPEAGEKTVDFLEGCRAGEIGKGLKAGGDEMAIRIPLTIFKIHLNI